MKLLQRIIVVLALVLSATLVAPAAPAQALPVERREIIICDVIKDPRTGRIILICRRIPIPIIIVAEKITFPWDPWCLSCPPYLDLRDVFPFDDRFEDRVRFFDALGRGLGLLGEAKIAEDPALQKELWWAAREAFWDATKILDGKQELTLGTAGYFDPKREEGVKHPATEPLAVSLVEGFRLMQKALHDPTPDPMIDEAMLRFEKAYDQFVELYSGAGKW